MRKNAFSSVVRRISAVVIATMPGVTPLLGDTILSQNFSTDPVNYTLPGNSNPFRKNGNDDFWAITGTLGGFTAPANITGADGAYLAVQDIDALTPVFTDVAPAQLDFTVSVSSYTDLRLSVALAGLPGAEPINFLRAKVDNNGDGTYETMIFNFTSPGGDNQPYTDVVPGSTLGTLSGAFQTKSNIVLPAPTAPDGNLRLRFEVFNDSGTLPSAESTGIDSILITGTPIVTTASTGAGGWHTPATWSTGAVPNSSTPVSVTHAVTVSSAAAVCGTLSVSGGGSVTATGQSLTVSSSAGSALATSGGTLVLDGSSSLTVPKATTSASFAGLSVASGSVVNVTNELTVDANKSLTGAVLNAAKLTLAGGTLTKGDGLTVGSGSALGGAGTVAGAVTVAGGGKVGPGTDTTVAAITVDGLTLSSGGLLTVNATDTATLDQVTVGTSGGLVINGGAITFLNGTGTAPVSANGVYNLIAYSGTIGGTGVSALTVANPVPGKRYAFGTAGGFVTLEVSQGPLWSGPDGGAWSLAANWSGATPVSSDTLVYAASGSGSSVNDLTGASFPSIQFNSGVNAFTLSGNKVVLTGDVNGVVVLNNSSNTQTLNLPLEINATRAVNTASGAVAIGGDITGTGTLVKSGSNALTLSGSNGHSGGVTLDAGTLNLNSAGALGAGGTFTINGGTINNNSAGAVTLTGNNPQSWAGNFTFTGTQDLNLGTGAVAIGAARTVTVSAKKLTVGGDFAGTGFVLTKAGAGSLAVSSPASLLGGLLVNAGTVSLDNSVSASPSLSLQNTGDPLVIRGQTARFEMNSGTLGIAGRWRLANDGDTALATITGGTINHTGSYLDVGFNQGRAVLTFAGTADYNGAGRNLQMSDANYCNTYAVFKDDATAEFGQIIMGITNGGAMQYSMINLSGNASVVATSLLAGHSQNQNNANVALATVNQTGGTMTVAGAVTLARDNRISGTPTTQLQGTYNLAGGTLAARQVLGGGAGVGGQARLNFRGGMLAAESGAKGAQAGDFIRLTDNSTDGKAFVWEGGSIDTAGKDVTINQPLLAPTGQGVAGIAVTAGGSGNFVPPAVRITGGGGTGATATAEINPATGAVTGITITNPGTDYTSAPTVVLDRKLDAATAATLGAVTLADNSSYAGGITKKGAGTLILPVANTYKGTTTVETGTLKVSNTTGSATGTGPVVVNSGAVLSGTGSVAGVVTNNGTISPGASIGTLTAGGATFEAGSVLQIELSPEGSPQIETATASGTADEDGGDVWVTVTGAGIAGSPVFLVVPVASGDTPDVWADKVRTALAANAAITALYTVSGSGADIVLTRTVPAAYDPTLNIALSYDPLNDPYTDESLTSADTAQGGPGGVDTLVLNGPLVINGGTLDLAVTGTPSGPAYVLITYTGTPPSGTFAVNNPPAGYIVDYDYGGNSVALVPGTVTDAYLSWAGPYGLTGADKAPGADPDKDGVDNGIEFMMGTSPVSAASRNLPSITRNPATGNLEVVFQRVDAAEAYNVYVDHGTTLQAPWTRIGPIPNGETAGPPVTVVDNGASADSITVIVTGAPDLKKFARVAIDIPYSN